MLVQDDRQHLTLPGDPKDTDTALCPQHSAMAVPAALLLVLTVLPHWLTAPYSSTSTVKGLLLRTFSGPKLALSQTMRLSR